MTVREAKKWLIESLQGVSDAATFEANELLSMALARDRNDLLHQPDRPITRAEQRLLNRGLRKRQRGMPLQYILGEWEFYSLPFFVGRGVLIPRADSELLVDLALEELEHDAAGLVFDLCAGSGALGISVAHHRPEAKVLAVEKSRTAFRYLTKNIQRNGGLVQPLRADIFTWKPQEKADLVLCNPPYITGEEMAHLERPVKKEPTLALFGGKDGLRFYRFFSQHADRFLKPGGTLILEIGWKQGAAVSELLTAARFTGVEILRDLSGNERAVIAVLPEIK